MPSSFSKISALLKRGGFAIFLFFLIAGMARAVAYPRIDTIAEPLVNYFLRPTNQPVVSRNAIDGNDITFDYSAADDNVTLRADEARELLKTCADDEVIKYRAGSWQCAPDNDTVTTSLPWESITGKPSVVSVEFDPVAMAKIGDLNSGKWCSELSGKITCTQNAPLASYTEIDSTVASSVKDGVTWDEVTGKPSVVSSESDPVALGKIGTLTTGKWCSELSGKITCTQNAPLTSFTETDSTVVSGVKDGVTWAEVTGKPAGFNDGTDAVGTLSPILSTHLQDGTILSADFAARSVPQTAWHYVVVENTRIVSVSGPVSPGAVQAYCGSGIGNPRQVIGVSCTIVDDGGIQDIRLLEKGFNLGLGAGYPPEGWASHASCSYYIRPDSAPLSPPVDVTLKVQAYCLEGSG